jgi:hypothetical protein
MAVHVPTSPGLKARSQAEGIFRIAADMRGLAVSIRDNTTNTEVFKVLDLRAKLGQFRTKVEAVQSGGNIVGILQALAEMTKEETDVVRTPAEIQADYGALYNAAGTLRTWLVTNIPGAGQNIASATVRVDSVDAFPYHTSLAPASTPLRNQVGTFLTDGYAA